MGLPVISTPHIQQVKAIIEVEKLGYILYDFEIKDSFYEFIDNVMLNRENWADKCINYVQNEYSWQEAGKKINIFYKKVINEYNNS
jgi:glycosyltransferase involved in cell wall biosynthesis